MQVKTLCTNYQLYLRHWSVIFIRIISSYDIAVCEVVVQLVWPSSTALVLPLWYLSARWYLFPCIVRVAPYCANIIRTSRRILLPLSTENEEQHVS
jgi:hypothetical protein